MTTIPIQAGALCLVLVGFLLERWRPAWALPVLIATLPLRMPAEWPLNPALPLFFGIFLGRLPSIRRLAADEPRLLLAMLVWPAWILLSASWAQQPAFVGGLLGKWLVVFFAFLIAAAGPLGSPRLLVIGLLVSIVPHALWAVAERLHYIESLGAPALLEYRGIDYLGVVRGKALFWHPNRLAEFVEQAALLLTGMAAGGFFVIASWTGVAIAMAGIWATGSTGGMATIFGGAMLCLGWTRMSGVARRRAIGLLALSILGAVVAGVWAFVSHGGIGSRQVIFDFAFEQIAARPWLGAGAGNWPLLVGGADLGVSRFWFQGHAHSLPLHIAVELGGLGLVAVALFFGAPLALAWSRFSALPAAARAIGTGASFAVLGILAHNLVHYFLRDPTDAIMTGLMLGLVLAATRSDDPDSPIQEA